MVILLRKSYVAVILVLKWAAAGVTIYRDMPFSIFFCMLFTSKPPPHFTSKTHFFSCVNPHFSYVNPPFAPKNSSFYL
jgi:hypothetical protein